MKYRYTKYVGNLLDEIDIQDLVSKLSDLLLSSGFSNPWGDPSDGDEDRTMQALHDAILEALFSEGVLSEEALQQLLASGIDFVLEGRYALKKISRNDERGYHAAETAVRRPTREASFPDEKTQSIPTAGGKKKYYN